jgi:arylsulfatase A-like enzyme
MRPGRRLVPFLRSPLRLLLLVLPLLALASACEREAPAAAHARPAPLPPSELNVVFVVLDAAAARYFGSYGNELPVTPAIDAFAKTATRFERAYAQAAWTLPSVGSIMTGRYPPMRSEDLRVVETETLARVLQREGLHTAAFSENPYVTREFGLATGFDEFHEYFPYEVLRRSADRFARRDSAHSVDEALAWLTQHQGERVFLYLHLLPPHAPYDAPPPFGGRFDPDYTGSLHGRPDTLARLNEEATPLDPRDLAHLRFEYQENLAYADHQAGRLLDGLAALGLLDRSLVIVAADHGEAFREHGVLLHNSTVYEEMIHVPLLLRVPSETRWPDRFDGVVELRAIFPTICEALDLSSCPAALAPSLFERMRTADERPGLARSWARGKQGTFAALILQQYKLIVQGHSTEPVALFDLASDPGETQDLRAAHPERVREGRIWLRDEALEFFVGEETPVAPDTRERLRALGYTE